MKAAARYTSNGANSLITIGDMYGEPPMADVTWNGGQLFTEQQYLRGDFIDVFDRGNERNQFDWTVWRKHDSLAASFQFVLDHVAELRGLAQIEFTFTPEGEAQFSRFMANAKVVATLLTKLGESTQWRYTVIGGEILKSNPNF